MGFPLPINWRLPGRPAWGAEDTKVDRERSNHSLAVAMVLHDMPQHDKRIDLDDEFVDAWGLQVIRVTLKPHRDDIDRSRYLIDRGADILEASGARSVTKVYADQITGNCSHQHGTARMKTTRARACSTSGAAPTRSQTLTRSTARLSHQHGRRSEPDHHGQRLARGGQVRRGARGAARR